MNNIDLQFAELIARTGLEADLAVRFAADRAGLLTEFGIPAHAVRDDRDHTLILEDLGTDVPAQAFCGGSATVAPLVPRRW